MRKYITFQHIIPLIIIISGCCYPSFSQTTEKVMFQDFTFTELKELGAKHTAVLIPVAQIEAKGPHLPVGADLYASLEICKKAAKKAGAIVGTPIPFGDYLDFICWPGYVVVDSQTMISIVKNYCLSLEEQGFGRIIFFVLYGGNVANTLRLAVLEHTRQYPSADIVVTTFGQVADRNKVEQILGKDADVGTSIALAVNPHLVQLDKTKDIEIKGDLQHLRKGYRTRKEYKLSHFFPAEVLRSVGKVSSKEIGQKLIDEAANPLVELCKEN